MKARGAEKNFCEIIARNVEGGADSAPPPGPFRVNSREQNRWPRKKKDKKVDTVELLYNEVIGTMKITFISGFSLYQGKKTQKYKELGPAKLPCYKRVLL